MRSAVWQQWSSVSLRRLHYGINCLCRLVNHVLHVLQLAACARENSLTTCRNIASLKCSCSSLHHQCIQVATIDSFLAGVGWRVGSQMCEHAHLLPDTFLEHYLTEGVQLQWRLQQHTLLVFEALGTSYIPFILPCSCATCNAA